MTTKKDTQKSTKSTSASDKKKGFTADERAAMKERAAEIKAEAQKADGDSAVVAKIAEMAESDRTLAEKLHEIIKANAPDLMPKLWYGMPSYATKEGKIVCFFQAAEKFNTRYATLGFNDTANLDDGTLWPVAFGLTELTAAAEEKISALVKKAVS